MSWGRGAFALLAAVETVWLVGQVVRDADWITGLCFYIPSALLAAACLGAALVSLARKRRRKALLAFALAMPPLLVAAFVENRPFHPARTAPPGALRLVHWNTAGRLGDEALRRELAALRADVYALSEIGDEAAARQFAVELGGTYRTAAFGTMAVVARGGVKPGAWLRNENRERVRAVAWEHDGRTLSLFVVDLPSDLGLLRGPMIERVNALIERDRPDLVVGDFNAPRRSRALAALPTGYAHAFDSAGSGIGYTWPVPVPLLAIDQCIHSSRIVPGRYALESSSRSDHRRQVFDFTCTDRPD